MSEKNILVKDLFKNTSNYEEKAVQVSGWVRTIRDSKNFGFIEINDRQFFQKRSSCF